MMMFFTYISIVYLGSTILKFTHTSIPFKICVQSHNYKKGNVLIFFLNFQHLLHQILYTKSIPKKVQDNHDMLSIFKFTAISNVFSILRGLPLSLGRKYWIMSSGYLAYLAYKSEPQDIGSNHRLLQINV